MTAFEFNTRIIALSDFIQGFALKYTHDEDKAKDLAQETILKALKNRDKFRTNTNLKGWLKVILKNTFINAYRKKSNQMVAYKSDDYKVMNGNTDNYKPDDILMTAYIQESIDQLPVELSAPFMLHVEGFKYHEISDKLGLALGTVKSRIHQTRKVLSAQFEQYYS